MSVLVPEDVGVGSRELFQFLQLVLAAIGGFIVRIGFKMVKSMDSNVSAIRGLSVSIGQLVKQHETLAAEAQVDRQRVMDAIHKGFEDVRKQYRKKDIGGPGDG